MADKEKILEGAVKSRLTEHQCTNHFLNPRYSLPTVRLLTILSSVLL